jgi:hypothetical protein
MNWTQADIQYALPLRALIWINMPPATAGQTATSN